MPLKIRRGTNTERSSVVLAEGEIAYTTDTQQLYVGDGSTLGGNAVGGSGGGLNNLVEDTSPQLGGNLDLNNNNITGTGNITVTGNLDSRGLFSLGTNDVSSNSDSIRTLGITRATSTSATLGSQIAARRARGTIFSPTTILSGDVISDITSQGHDGSDYVTSTAILGRATSTISTGVIPGQLEFYTANTSGVLTERLRINQLGTIFAYGPIVSENVELESDNSSNRLLGLTLASDDNIGSSLVIRKSRGTNEVETSISSDDIISSITAQGYDGAAYQISSRIIQRATGSVISGNVPGNIEFYTNNNSGVLQQRLNLTHDGFVNIGGNLTATGNVTINGYFSATNENAANRMLDLIQYNSGEPGVTVTYRKGRGTSELPQVVLSNDIISGITAQAYDGSGFQISSRILQRVVGSVSTGITPGQIEFYTTNSAGTSAQRLLIDSSGVVTVTGGLTVGSTVTTNGNVRFDNTTYTSGSYVLFRQYHNTADASNVTFARYRGTSSSPATVLQNDKVADLTFTAFDGTNAVGVGGINLTVTGPVATNSIPTRLAFLLHDGTSNATRFTIDNQGVVDFKAPELTAGAGSGQVDVSAVSKWMKMKLNGVEYAVPAYAINP
jgi:hypothetical protein